MASRPDPAAAWDQGNGPSSRAPFFNVGPPDLTAGPQAPSPSCVTMACQAPAPSPANFPSHWGFGRTS